MPRPLVIVLFVLIGVPSWTGDDRLPLFDAVPQVTVRRVPLIADDPARTRLGALTYLGGIALSAPASAFGGYSALAVDGDRFLLLGDGGLTLRFAMGRDFAVRDIAVGALPDGPGTGWQKRDRDSESLSIDPATGDVLVGFERYNGVWRYDRALSRPIRHHAPPEMAEWPVNGGPEAMARLRDGRYVILSEDADAPGGGMRGLIFAGDPSDSRTPAPAAFRFLPPDGHYPTDAAVTPDGRLLVLVRAFGLPDLFTARLVIVDSTTIRRGAVVRGRPLAAFVPPVIHDNFEGLAVSREDGATIVWVVSDDNGPSLLQRTLLLKFRLED